MTVSEKSGVSGLLSGIIKTISSSPNYPALTVAKQTFSYSQILDKVASFNKYLEQKFGDEVANVRIALFADRSLSAYVAIATADLCNGYIPYSLSAPKDRLLQQIKSLSSRVLVVDENGEKKLDKDYAKHFDFIVTFNPQVKDRLLKQGIVVDCLSEIQAETDASVLENKLEKLSGSRTAYVIFTSGSSGVPKAAVISYDARAAFIKGRNQVLPVEPYDRVAQGADLAWDVSVANYVMAWTNGAHLVVPSFSQMLSAVAFIRKEEISIWYSSINVFQILNERGVLQPNVLPSIRKIMFGGAPYPVSFAKIMMSACPNAEIISTYGPTEFSCECSFFKFAEKNRICSDVTTQLLPLGKIWTLGGVRIVDESGSDCPPGKAGELWFSGPQLADGYFNDSLKTEEAFPEYNGFRWYRSGDLVYEDQNGDLNFKGRADNQVKIHGYRVEIEDVEAHLLSISQASDVIIVPIKKDNKYEGLVAFLIGNTKPLEEIEAAMKAELPHYMQPDSYRNVMEFPRLANGKLDRKKACVVLMEKYC